MMHKRIRVLRILLDCLRRVFRYVNRDCILIWLVKMKDGLGNIQ